MDLLIIETISNRISQIFLRLQKKKIFCLSGLWCGWDQENRQKEEKKRSHASDPRAFLHWFSRPITWPVSRERIMFLSLGSYRRGEKEEGTSLLCQRFFFFFFQKGSFLVDYVFSVVSDSLSSAVVSHRLCVKKKWQPIRAWRAVAVTSEGYANVVPLSLVIQLVKFVSICHAKTNKPLMEKRRRARINHSLSVLKSLIIKDEVGLVTHTPFLDIIL